MNERERCHYSRNITSLEKRKEMMSEEMERKKRKVEIGEKEENWRKRSRGGEEYNVSGEEGGREGERRLERGRVQVERKEGVERERTKER